MKCCPKINELNKSNSKIIIDIDIISTTNTTISNNNKRKRENDIIDIDIPEDDVIDIDIISTINTTTSNNNKRKRENDIIDIDIPPVLFAGGFTYETPKHYIDSLVHRQRGAQINLPFHGLHLNPANGRGLPIDNDNLIYNCHSFFQENLIRNPEEVFGVKTTTTDQYGFVRGGFCSGCGFHLINPRRPNETVKYYNCLPETNIPNQKNYFHYSCYHSRLRDYNYCRSNAASSLIQPPIVSWALSQNNGLQDLGPNSIDIRSRWTFMECADLVYGMQLSGETHLLQKNYERVLAFCPILQCTNKTITQIRKKWQTLFSRRHQYVNMPLVDFDQLPRPP